MATARAMRALGRRLAARMDGGSLVALEGALGAGKTVLVQGMAAAWGIPSREVTSPTFALCRTHGGSRTLVHIDLYRIGGVVEAHEAGLMEWIDAPGDAVVAVEWFDRLGGGGPEPDWRIRIERTPGGARRVEVGGVSGG